MQHLENGIRRFNTILEEYYNHRLKITNPIWVRWKGKIQNLVSEQNAQERNTPFEVRFASSGRTEFIFFDRYIIESLAKNSINHEAVNNIKYSNHTI